jgi:glycosyltransferase involved in cell wall biosynthesis
MRASVVVPTYRRPDLLDRCLTALAAQDFDATACEVVVADDAASDATRRQVEGWAGRIPTPLRYIPVTATRGPAGARNAGWRAARGEVIAFTDDDCIPDPGWLTAGVAAVTAGADAATGRVVVPLPEEPTDYQRNEAGLEGAQFVTANCFVRRAALEAIGGFDERFTAAWREDSDLHFNLLKSGQRIVPASGAIVVHPVRPAPWGISLRQQRKTLFDALLYKKHPELYRSRIRPRPPWDYYATVTAAAAAVAGSVAGSLALAAAGAGSWLVLTGRFCARRLSRTSRAPRHVAEMLVTSALIPPLSVFWRLYGALRYRVLFL